MLGVLPREMEKATKRKHRCEDAQRHNGQAEKADRQEKKQTDREHVLR